MLVRGRHLYKVPLLSRVNPCVSVGRACISRVLGTGKVLKNPVIVPKFLITEIALNYAARTIRCSCVNHSYFWRPTHNTNALSPVLFLTNIDLDLEIKIQRLSTTTENMMTYELHIKPCGTSLLQSRVKYNICELSKGQKRVNISGFLQHT